jgi:transcriptional regulator with XRE-family HTH domain
MQALKRYLEEHSLTQIEFARQIGVRQPSVSAWVNGRITPSTKHLRIIAKETRIAIDELIAGTEPSARRSRRGGADE